MEAFSAKQEGAREWSLREGKLENGEERQTGRPSILSRQVGQVHPALSSRK